MIIKECDLMDAVAMSVLHETFLVPEPLDIQVLMPGRHIKVCAASERFWVCISEIKKEIDITMICRIDNDLVCSDDHGLYLNDFIAVNPHHVLEIYYDDELKEDTE